MDDGGSPYLLWILIGVIVFLAAVLLILIIMCRETLKKKIKLFDSEDVTEEEIISMVNEGHEQGVLLEAEAKMIHNIFEFDDKEAKDIMTHRKNMVVLDGQLSFTDAVSCMMETSRSRYPVYAEDIDHIIGVLHIKDAFAFVQSNEIFRTSIQDIPGLIRDVEFIPETMKINTLFRLMQTGKRHMVVVVDEYGQTSGVVAMEDILEEIVGNIEDEHDEEEELFHREADGSYTVDGLTSLDEVFELLHLEVEEESYDTLNGFLISQLDKVPSDGETDQVNVYGYEFAIRRVEDNIIREVTIRKVEPFWEEKGE